MRPGRQALRTRHLARCVAPCARNTQSIATEAALDGLYILSAAQADDAQCVRYYKLLAQVERDFRSMKSIDLHVRLIHHRLPERVRAPDAGADAPTFEPTTVATAQQQHALDQARQITV